MNQRIRLDDLTDDALDALYERLEAAEELHEAHVRVEQRLAREGLAAEAAVERLTEYADRMERHGHLVSAVSVAEAVRRRLAGPGRRAGVATGSGSAAADSSTAAGP